jgi:hypothetical protein
MFAFLGFLPAADPFRSLRCRFASLFAHWARSTRTGRATGFLGERGDACRPTGRNPAGTSFAHVDPDRADERQGPLMCAYAHIAVRALTADADALIAAQYGDATRVVLHDARLALTAPLWRERLAAADYEVTAVPMIRRPVEVAASLSRRDPVAPEQSLALWLYYLVEAEAGSRGMSRALVTCDRLLGARVRPRSDARPASSASSPAGRSR